MYNEDDKLEYVECTCTILAVRRKRRVEVKGENNILKCVGGGRRGKIAYLAAALGPLACLAAALGPLACLAAALGPLACLAAALGPLAWLT